jgi:hypothetical protein
VTGPGYARPVHCWSIRLIINIVARLFLRSDGMVGGVATPVNSPVLTAGWTMASGYSDRSARMAAIAATPPSSSTDGPRRKSSIARITLCAKPYCIDTRCVAISQPKALLTESASMPACKAAVINEFRMLK